MRAGPLALNGLQGISERSALLALAPLLVLLLGSCASAGTTFFVSPNGNDAGDGTSPDSALGSIQAAIDRAEPGDVVRVLAGEFAEDVETTRHGEANAPIRIIGVPDSSGRRPVLRGAGRSHIVDVRHSFIWIEDLQVDGLVGDPSEAEGYRSKLLYVSGGLSEAGFEEVRGVRLLRLVLRNAGTECVRLRYRVIESEIAESLIENCGVWDFRLGRGQKNGEAVYIGTAPEQLPEGAGIQADTSGENWVHHNFLRPNGAECIDVKEGSRANLIERNECSGQRDPDSGGISIRGTHNVVRHNVIHDNVGAGIRLGGDAASDGIQNEVVGNDLYRNEYASFKILARPQRQLCENRVRGSDPLVRGREVDDIDPRGECG